MTYHWRLKYNPDQPRVPAGSSQGGQWTGGQIIATEDLVNKKIPPGLVPDTVYIGLHADWYEGYPGAKKPSIKEHGMVPGPKAQFTGEHNRRDTIYAATTRIRAAVYANLYGRPMILEIDTGELDKERFYYDPLDFPTDLENPTQVGYRGRIPPGAIKVSQ